jgi:hypothetical protein
VRRGVDGEVAGPTARERPRARRVAAGERDREWSQRAVGGEVEWTPASVVPDGVEEIGARRAARREREADRGADEVRGD